LYLLRRSTQDILDFDHYLHDDVVKIMVEVLNTFKGVDQGLLRCIDILSCLTRFDIKLGLRSDEDELLTWRSEDHRFG
jgi:hypothetical protein